MLAILLGAPLLGAVGALVTPALGFLSYLAVVGVGLSSWWVARMVGELAVASGDAEVNPLMVWVALACGPFALYYYLLRLPQQVTEAKRRVGLSAARPGYMYLLLPVYSLAADLNELAGHARR